MANYIEFVGVPGVGKTTTYSYLFTSRLNSRELALYKDLELKQNFFRQVTDPKYLLKKFRLTSSNNSYRSNKRELLNSFVNNNPELLEMFWTSIFSIQKGSDPGIKFHRVNYLWKIIEKIQKIKEDKNQTAYLLDEGLIQNVNYFIQLHTGFDAKEQLKELIRRINDLPMAVVYFEGDPEIVVERSLKRKKQLGIDLGLSREDLLLSRSKSADELNTSIEIIEKKGIPVLRLRPDEEVETKGERVISFSRSL
jgi:hypothetical protein